MTMKVIQHVDVGVGGTSSISFTNIPQNYTDLFVVASLRNSGSNAHVLIGLNGSTSNFTERYISGYGSGQISSSTYARYVGNVGTSSYTANTFGSTSIYIANYASSGYKSILGESVGENNSTTDWAFAFSGNLWSQTAAITSLQLTNESAATILEYSSATLYGILKGSDGTTTVS
jgi:hypothetical protein